MRRWNERYEATKQLTSTIPEILNLPLLSFEQKLEMCNTLYAEYMACFPSAAAAKPFVSFSAEDAASLNEYLMKLNPTKKYQVRLGMINWAISHFDHPVDENLLRTCYAATDYEMGNLSDGIRDLERKEQYQYILLDAENNIHLTPRGIKKINDMQEDAKAENT